MKAILGIILIFGGLLVAAYVGIWWAFVGGIVAILNAVQTSPIDGVAVALGILRVMFAGTFASIGGGVFIFTGFTLATSK